MREYNTDNRNGIYNNQLPSENENKKESHIAVKDQTLNHVQKGIVATLVQSNIQFHVHQKEKRVGMTFNLSNNTTAYLLLSYISHIPLN